MALKRLDVGSILNWARGRDGDQLTGGVTMPAALLGSIAAGHVPAVALR